MKNLDFAKLTIWICLLLTAAGVGGHFYLKQRVEQAGKDKSRALTALANVSRARKDIRVLEDELDQDEYSRARNDGGQRSFFSAMARFAAMGEPTTGDLREDSKGRDKGYKDSSRELSWGKIGKSKQRFTREQIAKFLWKLEDRTNLLKVTRIDMKTDPSARDDRWTLTVKVTERMPTNSTDAR